MKKHNKKALVLVTDGGGCKGFIPARILMEIEKQTKKKCSEIFQFMAGTSIGAIIISFLSIKIPAYLVGQFFRDDGPDIFRKRWYRFGGLFFPKYPTKTIEEVLKHNLKESIKLSDCKSKILIPSFNLTTNEPFFFKSYDSKLSSLLLWTAARASSSAQLYFEPFVLGKMVLIDGGNCANNPSLPIYADLVKMGYKNENIKILSLGCGNYPVKENPMKFINCGAIRNLIMTLGTLFETGSEDTDYELDKILGKNYLRINIDCNKNFALDDASKETLDKMEAITEKWLEENYHEIEEFLDL